MKSWHEEHSVIRSGRLGEFFEVLQWQQIFGGLNDFGA